MNYKNAWKCKKCPQTATEMGCPFWWEIIMEKPETGETKVMKGCGFTLMPELFAHVSKNAVHAAAASYDMRNKVIRNVGKVIRNINEKFQLKMEEEELALLEDPDAEIVEEAEIEEK